MMMLIKHCHVRRLGNFVLLYETAAGFDHFSLKKAAFASGLPTLRVTDKNYLIMKITKTTI